MAYHRQIPPEEPTGACICLLLALILAIAAFTLATIESITNLI